jgi:3-deoxy-D-manno-octulosonic-acid transferase
VNVIIGLIEITVDRISNARKKCIQTKIIDYSKVKIIPYDYRIIRVRVNTSYRPHVGIIE